tara:strand:+ start:317 stop:478 length:162 start_codon:yes stop_codon:yes gene_type:complete
MEYLIAWNLINTVGLIVLYVRLSQEKTERYKNNIELESMIKKASPKLRRKEIK